MDGPHSGEATGAKRSRGVVNDFAIQNADAENDNEWSGSEEEEQYVKVKIHNYDESGDWKRNRIVAKIGERSLKRCASTDSNDSRKENGAGGEFKSLKRSFEGHGHAPNYEKETDHSVISRRTKQIEYGKNTPEYYNYTQAVPKETRQKKHPNTPNKFRKYSRRAWDGIVKQWRINLHCWSDFPIPAGEQLAANDSEVEKFNESFTSEASGSTSTTSSIAAAFSAELGFLNTSGNMMQSRGLRSSSESESGNESLNSTTVEKKFPSRMDQIIKDEAGLEKTLLSTSWADEVEDYYDGVEDDSDDEK